MTKNVLICGSIAFDTITRFDGYFKDHILPNNIHALNISFIVPTMRKEYGGCAMNIAYNLKQLGGFPIPVGCVGQDFGDYQKRIAEQGIEQRCIKILPDQFTAQCHITTDLSGNQITAFHPGAMNFSAQNGFENEDAAWGIVSPDSKEGMFAHAEQFAQKGIPFIFDLGQAMPLFEADDLHRMIKLASALTANDYEASVIAQKTGLSMEEISKHMQAVVVTRGENGADLYIDGQHTNIEPVKATVVQDPTGCGDAQRAGLLYALTNGWTWLQAAQLGNIMGSIKVESQGAQNHEVDIVHVKELFRKYFGQWPESK